MQDQKIQVSTAVSPALHPAVFDALDGVTDDTRPFIADAADSFQAAVDGLTAINDLRVLAAANPAMTPEARILQVATFADRKVAEIHKKIDAADMKLGKQIAFTESEMQRPLEATVHTSTAAEVRGLVRQMSAAERRKLVRDSIAANDMTVLSSILAAHPLLSGLTPLERDMYTRAYREKTQPALAQRLAVMIKAKQVLNDRSGLVMSRAYELVGAKPDRLAQLRAADSKFARAMAK